MLNTILSVDSIMAVPMSNILFSGQYFKNEQKVTCNTLSKWRSPRDLPAEIMITTLSRSFTNLKKQIGARNQKIVEQQIIQPSDVFAALSWEAFTYICKWLV